MVLFSQGWLVWFGLIWFGWVGFVWFSFCCCFGFLGLVVFVALLVLVVFVGNVEIERTQRSSLLLENKIRTTRTTRESRDSEATLFSMIKLLICYS